MNQIRPMRKKNPYYPKGRRLDDSALAEVRALLGDRPRRRDLLIEFLHLIQDAHGCLSAAHLHALAEEMRLAQTEVYEVATFYHHFDVVKEGETAPAPLTVRVCDGVACEMRGAREMTEKLKSIAGEDVRVVHAPCIGACDRAPAAVVKQRQVFNATPETVMAEVEAGRFKHDTPDYVSLEDYQAEGGYKVLSECFSGARSREDLIREVDESGLRGLGGAGFPTARKWGFLKNAPKPRLVAVNGDEGEPGTFKDRYILETSPHRFLEGVLLACWAVEAEAAYIYLRDEYPWCAEILHAEIARIEKAGLSGGIELHMRRGAGAYICGEESAMLESIEGKRGLPRNRPPFPAEAGLWGKPTLINNVETMYWLPEIAAKGAAWYQGEQRPHFYSVSGRVKNPGVKLAVAGVTARQLIEDHCGGMEDGETFYAYLPGGASGGVLPADLADEPLDFGALDKHGCFIGSSAVVVFSERDSIRDICKNLLRFFEDESCGQCTPCRAGCEKMLALMESDTWDEPLMNELSAVMIDASICGLGQAAPNPVKSAFRFFKNDL
ncbi:MAG: NAD(P)H-dependent oxidoreductase subunit E [Rhodospirillales bacterium]